MIFALLGKTVFARQIAVMGNMETERLYYCLSFHDILYTGLMSIRCEELSCLRKFSEIIEHLVNLLRIIFLLILFFDFFLCLTLPDGIGCLLRIHRGQCCDQIVSHLIYDMNTSAVNIQNDIISIILVLMDHFVYPFLFFL